MYYKITFSNGYCGCDENVYVKTSEAEDALESWAEDYLVNMYCPSYEYLIDPADYDTTDEYYDALDDYEANCYVSIVECTEEEYMDNEESWEEV